MKTKNEIERLAEETLKSLDGVEDAEPNEFMFTRIQSKLLSRKQRAAAGRIRLMYGLSCALLLFIALNVTSFYLLKRGSSAQNAGKQNQSGISAFAADYHLEQNSYNY